ncbi:hypothetical protein CVT24_000375 [Panaeolus cyanescens]|uniref:Calpain catalytic domain-containing protein n=1 Tax=Panaeolus cyanescens TaxID=181874 RepID=A0A409YD13_9AGAR|nr:hypothetical protein CVT24_000375 [Panaeolus cyanescens]
MQHSKESREAESVLSKASRAEFSKDYDQAFRLYLKSAQSFLHLSRSANAPDATKQQWKTSAAKALERAEKIKKFVDKFKSSANTQATENAAPVSANFNLTPVAINHLSPQEQFYVLKRGGNVNQHAFAFWDDSISLPTSTTYEDPDGQPTLSPEQLKVGAVWKRPESATRISQHGRRILPQEILQHIVTDCSVCASISVCLEHGRRFGSRLLESAVHPIQPPSGRYDIKMLFNGAWRRIGEEISRYMKIMGGYDFPGSNSSIDLHALTGWIPEHIEINRSYFEREKTWSRIEEGFKNGKCLITLGTGQSDCIYWRDNPLLSSHSYAVIDLYEGDEGRMFTVLDSWVRVSEEKNAPSRVLHIPWAEALNTFDGIYLSWDPTLWPTKESFHGRVLAFIHKWQSLTFLTGCGDEMLMKKKLSFSVDGSSDEEIWILLSRHITSTERTSDFISLRVDIEDSFIADKNSIQKQQSLSAKGTYTNSIHFLSRTRIPASQRSGILDIAASYEGMAQEIGFSISVFAKQNVKIGWRDNSQPATYSSKSKVEGMFTFKNAGGNCTYPTFMANPQYRLSIHSPTNNPSVGKALITLSLQSSKDVPVNVAMVWSQGQRLSELSERDLVATSGAYNYGLARTTKEVRAGEYTLLVSAFEPRYMGSFSLNVQCTFPFELKAIPPEGAGMYDKSIQGAWRGSSAAGGPSFDRYTDNPVYILDVPSLAQIKVRLQLTQPSNQIPLNISIYPALQGDIKTALRSTHQTTSGPYSDAIAGVVTPQITFGPGKYYIVPSTYAPGTEAAFRLIVYSSTSGIQLTLV